MIPILVPMEVKQLLFLIGPMGSGKSFLGKQVAEEIGLPFWDLDGRIELEQRQTITSIFTKQGEDAFRRIERDHLRTFLKTEQQGILATGGGTPCFFDNLARIKERGVCIYLKTTPETLAQRLLSESAHRPLLQAYNTKETLSQFLSEMIRKREQWYLQADVIFQVPEAPLEATQHLTKFMLQITGH
ncbi:MAG: shikimate kinase [Bacteroidota bacterium]